MESYPPLHRVNRSEAPTSVALALLLAEASLGPPLLRALAAPLSWQMWRWTEGDAPAERLTIPGAALEASALFFPFRDAGPADPAQAGAAWRGEIDVVAVVPRHVAIGFELKVLSPRGGLAGQMDGQVAGLKLLADRYECPFLAQIALAPAFPPDLPLRVNRLSFAQLRRALDELGAAAAARRDVLAVVARQIDHVLGLTERPSDSAVRHVTLEELRRMGRDPASEAKLVGVMEGLDELSLHSRPRWKVAEAKLSESWYPLPQVARRIEELLAGERASDRQPPGRGIRHVTLDELRSMGRDPANASKWVSVTEGIEALRLDTRWRWQVAEVRSNGNWHPLPEVVARIEEISGATGAARERWRSRGRA